MVQGGHTSAGAPAAQLGTPGSTTNRIEITNNDILGQSATTQIGTQGILANIDGGTGSGTAVANFFIQGSHITHTTGNSISMNVFGNSDAEYTVDDNTTISNEFGGNGIDFNGDGRSDIIWRHESGSTAVRDLNGDQLLATHDLGSVAAYWHIQGTGDFNADGRDDILWRDDDGTLVVWEMQAGDFAAAQQIGVAALASHTVGLHYDYI